MVKFIPKKGKKNLTTNVFGLDEDRTCPFVFSPSQYTRRAPDDRTRVKQSRFYTFLFVDQKITYIHKMRSLY